MMTNVVVLIGTISRGPTLNKTAVGISVLNFDVRQIATWSDKNGEDQSKELFHHCVQYGKLAEMSSRNLKNGDLIAIQGQLWPSAFEKDGRKEVRNEVKILTIDILKRGLGQDGKS